MISDKTNYLEMLQSQTAGGGGLSAQMGWGQPLRGGLLEPRSRHAVQDYRQMAGGGGWSGQPWGGPGAVPAPNAAGPLPLGGMSGQMGWPVGSGGDPERSSAAPSMPAGPSSGGGWQRPWASGGQASNYLEMLLNKARQASSGLAMPGVMQRGWSEGTSPWAGAPQPNRGSASDFSKFFMR